VRLDRPQPLRATSPAQLCGLAGRGLAQGKMLGLLLLQGPAPLHRLRHFSACGCNLRPPSTQRRCLAVLQLRRRCNMPLLRKSAPHGQSAFLGCLQCIPVHGRTLGSAGLHGPGPEHNAPPKAAPNLRTGKHLTLPAALRLQGTLLLGAQCTGSPHLTAPGQKSLGKVHLRKDGGQGLAPIAEEDARARITMLLLQLLLRSRAPMLLLPDFSRRPSLGSNGNRCIPREFNVTSRCGSSLPRRLSALEIGKGTGEQELRHLC